MSCSFIFVVSKADLFGYIDKPFVRKSDLIKKWVKPNDRFLLNNLIPIPPFVFVTSNQLLRGILSSASISHFSRLESQSKIPLGLNTTSAITDSTIDKFEVTIKFTQLYDVTNQVTYCIMQIIAEVSEPMQSGILGKSEIWAGQWTVPS